MNVGLFGLMSYLIIIQVDNIKVPIDATDLPRLSNFKVLVSILRQTLTASLINVYALYEIVFMN